MIDWLSEWGSILTRFINIVSLHAENEGGGGDGYKVEKVKVETFDELLKSKDLARPEGTKTEGTRAKISQVCGGYHKHIEETYISNAQKMKLKKKK